MGLLLFVYFVFIFNGDYLDWSSCFGSFKNSFPKGGSLKKDISAFDAFAAILGCMGAFIFLFLMAPFIIGYDFWLCHKISKEKFK